MKTIIGHSVAGLVTLLIYMLSLPAVAQVGYDSAEQPAQDTPLTLSRITPKGEDVPAGRQIVFQFDRKVVPVGRMDRQQSEIPISISPKLDCEWRWLNTSALACQLGDENKMQLATRYDITVNPGIKTEAGVGMSEPVHS